MQIVAKRRDVLVHGAQEAEEFKVEANAHLMAILSGLYSDIPWAVVREYGTNMLDGYIALPEDADIIPPQIHIPTIVEPYIEFKDFGTGMDFDTVWKVYKTYGASTKTGNNEEVGGFGLGAKTAFCYEGCDSWSVESRFNGKRMIFTATRDEKGVPTLFHVATLDTTEQSGVTVRIPVAVNDFTAFKKAVSRLAEFYPLELTITGDTTFTFEKRNYILKGKHWAIREERGKYSIRYYSSSKVVYSSSNVVMGNVPYPVDMDLIFAKRPEVSMEVGSLGVDFRLPIGAVDIVPSREALKYTERTLNRLTKAIDDFYRESREMVEEAIEGMSTEWEVITFVYNVFGNIDYPATFLKGLTWRGKEVRSALTTRVSALQEKFPGLSAAVFTQGERAVKRVLEDSHMMTLSPNPRGGHPLRVYIDDLGKGVDARMGLELKKRMDRIHMPFTYVFSGEGVSTDSLSVALGGFPVELCSSLEAPPKTVKTKQVKPKTLIAIDPLKIYTQDGSWVEVDQNIEEKGYFILLNSAWLPGEPETRLIKRARELKLVDDLPIYAIPSSRKGVEKEYGLTELVGELTSKVQTLVESKRKEICMAGEWEKFGNSAVARFFFNMASEKLPKDSMALEAQEVLRKVKAEYETTQELITTARMLGIWIPSTSVGPWRKMLDELNRAYPILRVFGKFGFSYFSYQQTETEICDYLALVERDKAIARNIES